MARSGFAFARRSQDTDGSASDVLLLDSIGELAGLYRFAAVVFVGGSLVPRGGHNIIEPAAFAKPIIVGRYTDNFRQIISDFRNSHALVQVDAFGGEALAALTREMIRLLTNHELAREMGLRARNLLNANRGASECTIASIKRILHSHQI
jgi:3-deoxy-D-manno-octulosonic-acid transferase